MCRSSNAISICYDHMEWKEDCLRVFFAHMKNDQVFRKIPDRSIEDKYIILQDHNLYNHICLGRRTPERSTSRLFQSTFTGYV